MTLVDSSDWPLALASAASGAHSFTGGDWVLTIVLICALLLAALSAAAETALTSVSKIRMRSLAEEGDARAMRVVRLIEKPQVFLTSILVTSNVSIIVASTVATILALNISTSWGGVVSTIALALFVLIFCEITPKTAAVQAPERWAKRLVGPVEVLSTLLRPINRLLIAVTTGIVRLIGGQPVKHGPFVTEEELRLLVEVGEEEGVLEQDEREMIHNVFELADTAVREIMVPRIDMITIEADDTLEEAMRLIVQGGQSRIPVMEESIDNIIGVLYAKDLLRVVASHQSPATVKRLVRPAYFVPESKRLDDLLRELQQQRVHMAIVVDEYGSVAGLVTIEDVVEEIIGDIQDEYDREEQLIEQVGENEFIVDAKISLDEFNELLDLKLTSEEYETLGGFMFAQLDKIPTVGDVVRHQNLTMTVLGTKGRRITKVRVVRHAPDESGPAEADTSQSGLAAPNGSTPTSQPGLDGIAPEVTAPSDDGPDGNDLGRFDSPGDDESTDHRLPSVGYADVASDDGVAPSRTSRARSSATRRHPHGPPQSRRR
jgi:CBS domain containing-hemolysin-like protein